MMTGRSMTQITRPDAAGHVLPVSVRLYSARSAPPGGAWRRDASGTQATRKDCTVRRIGSPGRHFILGILAVAGCFASSGCVYTVPITAKATRNVDRSLLGDWTSKDGSNTLKIVQLDDSNYIVCLQSKGEEGSGDCDLYRAFHSDVAKAPFVSVQILDEAQPRYSYWNWRLAEDGTLHLRPVNDKVVPDETQDAASVRRQLEENLRNPDLFGEDEQFTKDN